MLCVVCSEMSDKIENKGLLLPFSESIYHSSALRFTKEAEEEEDEEPLAKEAARLRSAESIYPHSSP